MPNTSTNASTSTGGKSTGSKPAPDKNAKPGKK